MKLRELFAHFDSKITLVVLSTPLWRKSGGIKYFEREFDDSILNAKVSNWYYSGVLNIDIQTEL